MDDTQTTEVIRISARWTYSIIVALIGVIGSVTVAFINTGLGNYTELDAQRMKADLIGQFHQHFAADERAMDKLRERTTILEQIQDECRRRVQNCERRLE